MINVKIFGIGLFRTGTTSLHMILCSFGYRSGHFSPELLADNESDIMDQFDAMTDTPFLCCIKNLIKNTPIVNLYSQQEIKQVGLNP